MPEPPDITLPPEVVRMAARRLSAGQTTVEEVLQAVVRDLRRAGWSVEAPEPAGFTRHGHLRTILWPTELPVPQIVGEPGSYTIAPWSVKLTPQPSATAKKSTSQGEQPWPRQGDVVLYGSSDRRDPHPAIVVHPHWARDPNLVWMMLLHVFDGTDGGSIVRNVPRESWRWLDELPA